MKVLGVNMVLIFDRLCKLYMKVAVAFHIGDVTLWNCDVVEAHICNELID